MCNCPNCGSNNVQVQTDEELMRSFYHCDDCGNEWSRAGINRKGGNTPKAKNPYPVPALCIVGVLLMLVFAFSGGKSAEASEQTKVAKTETAAESSVTENVVVKEAAVDPDSKVAVTEEKVSDHAVAADETAATTDDSQSEMKNSEEKDSFTLEMVPAYSGNAYVDINDDIPFFTEDELTAEPFQEYWPLDELGRSTGAIACIGPELLPVENRVGNSTIEPTGWHSVQYDGIDGGYLYNRCHLIGYQLTGETADEKNLITGTRYMNLEGMLPFENSVRMYVEGTGNHVLYRVRPYYNGDNLLADGVLMEAKSIEDPLVQFCAFCYNVQPDIEIDYATGESLAKAVESGNDGVLALIGDPEVENDASVTRSAAEETPVNEPEEATPANTVEEEPAEEEPEEITYILNTNTKKFHYPYCKSVKSMKDKNKRETTQSRDEIIRQGYDPCKNCNP